MEGFGPNILQEVERQVCMVRENMWIAQSRRNNYADHRRRELSFKVGDYVYLKVLPISGLRHFKIWDKLAPRYIGPFKIIAEGEEELKAEFPCFFSDPSES
jgi:hypothetical protein